MGDTKLQDARFDKFQSQNPDVSYGELASMPGDAVAQCVADEVLRTDVRRCILIVNASKELVARWVQAQFRFKQPRALEAIEAPGPPRLCRNAAVCGLQTLTQSQYYGFCCQKCASSQGAEHDDYCRFHLTDEPTAAAERPHQGGSSANAGSDAGSDADEPGVIGVTGDELNRALAAVCTIVGCCRPSRMTAQFADESGMCTVAICCYPCVTGEGHAAECDAASAVTPAPAAGASPAISLLDGDDTREPEAAIEIQRVARGSLARVAFLILLTIPGGPTAEALLAGGMDRLGPVAMDFSAAPRIGRARTQILRAGANNPQRRTADGSTKKGVSRKAMLHSRGDKAIRGGPRPMHGNLRFGSPSGSGSAEAEASLLSQSVSEGTKNTYATAFIPWAVWRKARKQTLLLDPSLPGSWEDELCAFYAHVGWNMGYSWSYCHSTLYSIRRAHRLVRTNLDIRDGMMPLLSMLRKGRKRICGSPKRKIAVTVKLLLTILLLGWLDLGTWDGLLTWTALVVGFYFLLRSSEFLRKSADPDAQK